eukprot:870972_1
MMTTVDCQSQNNGFYSTGRNLDTIELSLYHVIGACRCSFTPQQQSFVVIASYVKEIQNVLTNQLIPHEIIILCFRYYHFMEIPINGLSERDFYKKYWIEAGKLGGRAYFGIPPITRKTDKTVFALRKIKKVGKSSEYVAALQREILILQNCSHPNVIHLADWCDTRRRIYMVVEFCSGGDLFERILDEKQFNEKSAIHITKQIVSALHHIHLLGYVHRNLEPSNIMFVSKAVDSTIKLIDLQCAGDCNHYPCNTPVGSAHYTAPEVLESIGYTQSVDMWSVGVILYTLLCGFPPFFDGNNNMTNLYQLIKNGTYSFPAPFWNGRSEDAKDLIRKLLIIDPKHRLNAKQVLQHEWIINNNANDQEFGKQYIQQMRHWQSVRHTVEFCVAHEPPPPPTHPINLHCLSGL